MDELKLTTPAFFELDPGEYARSIRDYSDRSTETSLYSGHAFQNLVHHHFRTKIITSPPEKPSNGFASYYSVVPGHGVSSHHVVDYSCLNKILENTENAPKSGHLLILRGHPPTDFPRTFGAKFTIDPEFFRRHTDYLTTSDIQAHFVTPPLPSHADEILQVRLTTIGNRGSGPHHGHNQKQIRNLRSIGATGMRLYLSGLRKGERWQAGDSIVRGYKVHDEDLFSLDQKATICMKSISRTGGMDHWIVTIWLDCGRDLAHSPSGPWLSKAGYQAQMIPVFRHSPEAPFREIQARDRGGTDIPQAASNLYRDNCSSVVTDLSTFNPFSALFELLLFSAAAESQFLNMISSNLHQNREMLFNDSNDENVVASSRSNLMHSLDSLEEHMKDYREIVAFVQRRRERPSSENSDPAWASTVNQILTDFKCLLNRSELLCRKCERNMSIVMSNASIAEAKRGLEQSQSLFKFTVLASVYVPLSFTASFFGMNFREIGQGKLSIWLYFAVSLPIFALSALTLFLDKKAVQVWFSELT